MYGLNSTIDKQARREENDFLNFYGKHRISPVRQDLSNKEIHYRRREKLYRQLGMPIILFKDANMLEVGPGGGYNTLAFFEWNIRHIDLVEANPRGIEDMKELFNGISKDKYSVHSCLIEEYKNNNKYDIIIAESFLQFLKNQREVIDILKEKVVDGGVVVITCSDEVCFFIEQIKRLFAHAYVKDIDNYEKKVEILAEQFAPQLATLRGVSRNAEDWVQDQLLNEAGVNGTSLNIEEAITYFGDDFDVLGGSPGMFEDYSWYKDIWYDYKKDYIVQFREKNINLVLANMKDKIYIQEYKNNLLRSTSKKIKELAVSYENEFKYEYIEQILEQIDIFCSLGDFSGTELTMIIEEMKMALKELKYTNKINFEKYKKFFAAFGRTQQYVSFVKKKYKEHREV